MVFKRRNPRSYLRMLAEAFWPRGGWTRAFHYVKHRIRRLPDDPHRIARGVGVGVFVSFTPLFGLHLVAALIIAKILRGNILAAILGTFFGNPVTFPVIAVVSMKLGNWMLGTRFDEATHRSLASRFLGAAEDLKHNFFAIFFDQQAHWGNLAYFYHDIFLPYLIGGLVPGLISGVIAYYLSAPVIAAYQKRRRKKLKARFEKLRARLQARNEEARKQASTAE